LVHGVAHKWAYIMVSGSGLSFEAQTVQIRDFASRFYPKIALQPSSGKILVHRP
jgi:hypothetical protein